MRIPKRALHELFSELGKRGIAVRNARLSKSQRSEIARKAARTRWLRWKQQQLSGSAQDQEITAS
jgi:hypothetical protein